MVTFIHAIYPVAIYLAQKNDKASTIPALDSYL